MPVDGLAEGLGHPITVWRLIEIRVAYADQCEWDAGRSSQSDPRAVVGEVAMRLRTRAPERFASLEELTRFIEKQVVPCRRTIRLRERPRGGSERPTRKPSAKVLPVGRGVKRADVELARYHYSGEPTRQLAAEYGCTADVVRQRAVRTAAKLRGLGPARARELLAAMFGSDDDEPPAARPSAPQGPTPNAS
jgi:hypothetical protein